MDFGWLVSIHSSIKTNAVVVNVGNAECFECMGSGYIAISMIYIYRIYIYIYDIYDIYYIDI